MDVRQKQRFSYRVASRPVACPLPVFAHVISIVMALLYEIQIDFWYDQ